MSKGSKQRPTDKAAFDEAYDRIFGAKRVCEEMDMGGTSCPTGQCCNPFCEQYQEANSAPVKQKKERKEKK